MIDRDQLQGPLGVSLAASILLFVIGCWLLLPALGSLRVVGGGDNLDDAAYDRLVAAHDVAHRTDLNRIHGRSFFFEPPAPPRPKPPEPIGACCIEDECRILKRDICRDRGGRFIGKDTQCSAETCEIEPPPPPPPPPDPRPRRYGGPDLIAIYGSDAIFRADEGLMVIPLGQEMDEIEVIAIDPPSHIDVMWRGGGPFEVELFEAPGKVYSESGLAEVFSLPTESPIKSSPEGRPTKGTQP